MSKTIKAMVAALAMLVTGVAVDFVWREAFAIRSPEAQPVTALAGPPTIYAANRSPS